MSTTNAHNDTTNYTSGMAAAITGRSGSWNFSNIRFYNYPEGSVMFKTCRFCDDPLEYTNLGTQVNVDKLTFTNVSAKMLFMIGLKRDVIYDLDGSFSNKFDAQNRSSGTIIHGWDHIATFHQDTCPPATNSTDWDNAIMCDHT